MKLFSKKKILDPILFGLSIFLLLSCIKSNNDLASVPLSPGKISKSSENARFGIPVNCTLGKDCFILLYPDRDPGPNAIDFGCGRQTYNSHKGTDFAIANLAQVTPVVAVADGTVVRIRDGMKDHLIANEQDRANVKGIECGNGLVIRHEEGWETQYCHLRKGSIKVRDGTQVKKGDKIGLVGASGLASFPHVHLNIRYQNQIVDPFVGINAEPGCQQKQRQPLWDRSLVYTPSGNIDSGFSPVAPQLVELWQGEFQETSLSTDIPALFFWVHNYGVKKGDLEYFKLVAPDGTVIVDKRNIINKSQKDSVRFIGKRNNPQRPLVTGIWSGEYQLKRGNKTIITLKREVKIN